MITYLSVSGQDINLRAVNENSPDIIPPAI
jgi:hypothetical protein